MQVSRQRALEMQEGKAAEFTVTFALDHYRETYRKQFAAMLKGEPYSKMAMDNALENIMRIACDDEMHQRYGEVLAEQDQGDSKSFLDEPTDDELRAIEAETELENDVQWLYTDPRTKEFRDQPQQPGLDGADDRASTGWREHGVY